MKIISFAHTTPALLAGRKTVTRREWKHSWAMKFSAGDYIQAYDKDPRYGGRKVAIIQLTVKPYLQDLIRMPFSDYECEGFKYMDENPKLMKKFLGRDYNPDGDIRDENGYRNMRHNFLCWKLTNPGASLWVVRFRLIEIFDQESFLPGFKDFERTPKLLKGEGK